MQKYMRYLLTLITIIFSTSCNTIVTSHESQKVNLRSISETQVDSLKAIEQFLIEVAATDFHTHRQPDPVEFRNVRIGYIVKTGGEKQYMMCGEFLSTEDETEWISFLTIKTDPYEQWIGFQAEPFCKEPSAVWENVDDLSFSLKKKYDSLK